MTGAQIIFVVSHTYDRAQWQAFAHYFQEHGYRCFAWLIETPSLQSWSGTERMEPETSETVRILVCCGADARHLPEPGQQSDPQPLAILFPPTRAALKLAISPPLFPVWLAWPGQSLSLRAATKLVRGPIKAHRFDGIRPALLNQPGWERVAYALRVWIESSLVAED
ncbi:MAG: hypothetical protein J5I90_07070 [Caldilineales bacterium]|nr:hypothetical protein [Caldilineales bacterium]